MNVIEIENLAFFVNKIEAILLVPGKKKNEVRIFLRSYRHSVFFDDEDKSVRFYATILAAMNKIL